MVDPQEDQSSLKERKLLVQFFVQNVTVIVIFECNVCIYMYVCIHVWCKNICQVWVCVQIVTNSLPMQYKEQTMCNPQTII